MGSARQPEIDERALERARREVHGWLVAPILHETNNVLTVMAGVRQLLKAGAGLSERIGAMIDQQIARMEELARAVRRLGLDDGEGATGDRPADELLEVVCAIVQLVGKGRGVAVERAPAPGVALPPSDAEAIALAALGDLLANLPRRGERTTLRISLSVARRGESTELEAAVAPAFAAPAAGEATRAALVARGGRIEWRPAGERSLLVVGAAHR